MKIIYRNGDSEKVIAEAQNENEVIEKIIEDMKTKFIFPKKDFTINLKSKEAVFALTETGDGYYIEE